jgi:hypothetical protein
VIGLTIWGALIAFRLDVNREKGGICGGLIASHLLALHGVMPHFLDLQFPEEKLDLSSMIHHKFISPLSSLINLTFELTFFKKTTHGAELMVPGNLLACSK